jgi:hypothetical protein
MEDDKISTLKTSEVDKEDREKIQRDLSFIEFFTRHAAEKGLRVVVSGGYATDGNLSRVTRPHNDLDIIVYGQ